MWGEKNETNSIYCRWGSAYSGRGADWHLLCCCCSCNATMTLLENLRRCHITECYSVRLDHKFIYLFLFFIILLLLFFLFANVHMLIATFSLVLVQQFSGRSEGGTSCIYTWEHQSLCSLSIWFYLFQVFFCQMHFTFNGITVK